MPCLTIRLHSHSAIYFSILFVFLKNFLHFCLIAVVYISLFIVLYIAVCLFTMCCAIWYYGHKIE